MNRKEINYLLKQCLKAPEGQLCPSTHEKIKGCLDAKDDDLHKEIELLIGECAYFSLASGFVMVLLGILLENSKQL